VPFEQLDLPITGLFPEREPSRIPRTNRVFVNRNLRLSGIDWVGFDMDYTLAIYKQPEIDRLSIAATAEKLVAKGYPAVVREIDYPIDFPIRGLLIDKRLGNILKLDRFKVAQKGYHGLRKLTRDELRQHYQPRKIRPATPRYHFLDTLYALSEATMYASIVDTMEKLGMPVDYQALFTDIRQSIDEAHADGTILNQVAKDLPRYVDRDPVLAATLHKLRSAGKRLFLLTNSRWPFTEVMMTHLLGGAMPEYPSFRHYFDVLVVAAQKPAFFQERRPLLSRNADATRPAIGPLERGTVYEGGNLIELERFLGVTGDRVLYIGDHIYGDILRSKKESAWRTAMVIQEMEAEVLAHEACREEHRKAAELESQREELEDELRHYQQRFKEAARRLDELAPKGTAKTAANAAEIAHLEAERTRAKRAVERVRGSLRAVDLEVATLEEAVDARFHPYWGSLLKEANETSSFGDQVEEYACVYTSRVSNFYAYSPLQSFRSPRDVMPHEL
jgi:5'-nucleotidase